MLVTLRALEFDGEIVPAGTACTVYNRHLHEDAAAEGLLREAQARKREAGRFTHLVMFVDGRARLLAQEDIGNSDAPPPKAKPKATTPAPVQLRQASLF